MKKIDSCLIIKNEEKNIKALIEQLLIFSNEIHITDTGSTDKTIKIINGIIKKHKNVFLHNFEWVKDFSKARNYSFNCYECNADYILWCDGDDKLNDQLIKRLQEFKEDDNCNEDVYSIKYHYFIKLNYWHWRNFLVKASKKYQWINPIHEYFNIGAEDSINYTYFDDGSGIIHLLDDEAIQDEHRMRNLDIFMNMEKNNYEFTPRNRYYFGRELCSLGYKEYGEHQLKACIDSPLVGDNILFKVNACILLFLFEIPGAIDYFFKMVNDGFVRKDMLHVVGTYYLNNGKPYIARMWFLACLNYDQPTDDFSYNYDMNCHLDSLGNLGMIENNYLHRPYEALKYFNELLTLDPNNELAKNNINLITNELKKFEANIQNQQQ